MVMKTSGSPLGSRVQTVEATAPVLALCRKLLALGINPAAALLVFRGDVLALRVKSIGLAAGLDVQDNRLGVPVFRRRRALPASDGAAAPIRFLASPVVGAPAA